MLLVSAIMPTRGRPGFAQQALENFRAQTYAWRELVIVDDWDAPSFPTPPEGPGIQYHVLMARYNIGKKRNIACARSAGDVLIHWDDDDYSAPGRIEDQVRRLLASGGLMTGYHTMLFEDETGARWRFKGPERYALGTSLCYTREFWRLNPFEDFNVGEDNVAVRRAGPIVAADAGELMRARIHPGNTADKRGGLGAACWSRVCD